MSEQIFPVSLEQNEQFKKSIWESMLSILSGNILHLCCQQLGRHQLFFQFPDEVRRILYTTNVIEWLIRQYRKVTKTKSVSPVTAYWKRCSIWQARMWQRNGPSAIAARIRSSAS